MRDIKDYITTIPDFPEQGIMFRDITTVIQDKNGFKLSIDKMKDILNSIDFDVICAIESRGFIFASVLAYTMQKELVLIRKKGKLPREVVSKEYDLEYGTATIEIHKDAIKHGQKAIIIDDLLATGGTANAAVKLVEELGGIVTCSMFLIELKGLKGRKLLENYRVESIVQYDGK